MNTSDVLGRLTLTAAALSQEIDRRPAVSHFVGTLLKARLESPDWCKSRQLFDFARPMAEDPLEYYKPAQSVVEHAERQLAQLPPGATSLDGLEHLLVTFQAAGTGPTPVVGVENWFAELRGEQGYTFDKRFRSMAFEMKVIAPMFGGWRIQKLRRSNQERVPDYEITRGDIRLLMDAKCLFGRAWPLTVLKTMLECIARFGNFPAALDVMAVASDGVELRLHDLEVSKFVDAVVAVASNRAPERSVDGIRLLRRTHTAQDFRLLASYREINGPEDAKEEITTRIPRLETYWQTIQSGWRQIEEYDSGGGALPVVALTGDIFGHPELTEEQAKIEDWLASDEWPDHPGRCLAVLFTDIAMPRWYIGPRAKRDLRDMARTR